ncbi:MAG: hypothetical protein GY719_26865 [bacterium]|nr:hypothetical protein [bacterium]
MSAAKSVLANAGTAADTLDPKLRSFLQEGESIDGIGSLMLTLVRWIEGDKERLEEHETEQRREQRKLKQLRIRRDRKQKTLYSRLLGIRQTFEDAFGKGTAAIYLGLEPGLIDLEPVALRRLARETVTVLDDPAFTTPVPAVQGLWANPTQYAEQILECLEPFEDSLDAIEAQKREVEKAQKARGDLLEEMRKRLKWAIRLFEAIYQLANLGFHADRLRLKVSSRPSSTEQAAGEETGGDAAEADGDELAADADEPADSSEPSDSTTDG